MVRRAVQFLLGRGRVMGDAIYNQAVKEMKSLAEHVIQDIQEFADEHDYEKSWVVERFREEFNRISRKEG